MLLMEVQKTFFISINEYWSKKGFNAINGHWSKNIFSPINEYLSKNVLRQWLGLYHGTLPIAVASSILLYFEGIGDRVQAGMVIMVRGRNSTSTSDSSFCKTWWTGR